MKNQQQIHTRQRGSVMLFVIVLLVLLALIGTAYIQQARYDQIAATASIKNNIGTVANATLAYIGEVLKNDLLNDSATTMFDGTTDEPYDYPWTNNGSTFQVRYWDEPTDTYKDAAADGGTLDDTWLASTEPDLSGPHYSWDHITNLNGLFLRIPKSTSLTKTKPFESVVTVPLTWQTDTNVPMTGATSNIANMDNANADADYEDVGVDADGDGILDSKWTWAPIRQISGISYVMAVRIIDNSSMVNANVALGQVTASDTFDTSVIGLSAPRWLFPTELDFSNFYFKTDAFATAAALNTYFDYRFVGTGPGSPLIPWYGSADTRFDFWTKAASLWGNYGTGYKSLTTNDELEMRFRNGLNNIDIDSSLETSGIGSFLRKTSATESTYDDWDGATVSTKKTFFENEPRHQITAHSGASIYAMRLADRSTDITFNGTTYTPAQFNDSAFLLKKDINSLSSNDLALEVFKVLSRGSFNGLSLADIQTYTNQFVASFEDHFDEDNLMTTYQGMNGVEAWPAIAEVYTQRPVNVTAFVAGSQTNFWNATGTPTGKTGYVIEIINPHTKPIPISDIHIDLTYKDSTDTSITNTVQFDPTGSLPVSTLSEIISTTVKDANHGDEWLYPGQQVLIYHDSTGGSTDSLTSTLLQNRDSVADYIFDNNYNAWATATAYVAGNFVYQAFSSKYAVYECLIAHTSDAAKKPNDSSQSYLTPHSYWRRKIIAVDGGTWPVLDSDYYSTGKVKVNLYPATQAAGTKASFPYQSVTVKAWDDGDSVFSADVAYDLVNNWITGTTYNLNDKVRNFNASNLIYRWTNATSSISVTSPELDPTNWAIAADENILYAQANSVGSVDGLEALALKDGDFFINDSTSQTPVAPHSEFFAQIAKTSKILSPVAWIDNHTYAIDDTVVENLIYYACVVGHTVPLTGLFTDDSDKWVKISFGGRTTPVSGVRGNLDQLLMTDMRGTHDFWQDGRDYFVGDVVRNQNGTRMYNCILGHTASTASNKPITGSSWATNWVEHWRSASNGYPISNITELAQIFVAGPQAGTTLPDILGINTLT
ncbi:MAG: hypothetical protein JKX85_06005, partial [Phycisphaeraceae bacterium]|nr:hypothetical protein [Phycisphaeraceae bacterium]